MLDAQLGLHPLVSTLHHNLHHWRLTVNLNCFSKSGAVRTGEFISMALILSNASWHASDQINLEFFLSKLVIGFAMTEKFGQYFRVVPLPYPT